MNPIAVPTFKSEQRIRLQTVGCMLLLLLWASARSATLPAGFQTEMLVDGINAATALSVASDGTVFYANQTGLIHVYKNGRAIAEPVLDVSDRVDDYWERGLIGMDLHPDFPRSPYLYIVYVLKNPFPHHRVSRFTVNGYQVDPDSEQVLIEGDDQSKLGGHVPAGHQGGIVRVGPDGKLYFGIGEQTAGKPAQSLDSFLGKIHRINLDGSIPSDNPFHHSTHGKYRAIWAYGIRNPFGMAFQPGTGRLFVTDVGQTSFEEVNEIFPGKNYGWPEAEGIVDRVDFINPIHAYPPAVGRSIVGGMFYPTRKEYKGDESGLFPENWQGRFFFADWASHWIKAMDPNDPTDIATFGRYFNGPVALEPAPDGSMILLNRGTIWRDGKKFVANSGSLVRIYYDQAQENEAPKEMRIDHYPKRLSEYTGLSVSNDLQPGPEFHAFEINAPPWLPGVQAKHWISIPEGGVISVSRSGQWGFPQGARVIRHFIHDKPGSSWSGKPFETHLYTFVEPRLVDAVAYRWQEDGTEAYRLDESEIIPLPSDQTISWFSPGREFLLDLDGVIMGFLFPVKGGQVNREVPSESGFMVNQLKQWDDRGWFSPAYTAEEIGSMRKLSDIHDPQASLENRVRSYLDVNCSACHRPGGLSRGYFDARIQTPLIEQGLINGMLMAGDLGVDGAKLVLPGFPEKSVLYQRTKRFDYFRMPPVTLNDQMQPIVPVLEKWILSLQGAQ